MSWDRTYSHNALIAVDQFAAALIFNRPDLTISSLCRVVQLADAGDAKYVAVLAGLKFSNWQVGFLSVTARVLERIQAGHCEAARLGDLARTQSAASILNPQ